ncbi:hypothetical protein VMT65_32450 [Nocardia sp. CDC153]|uniref:hypothetical protein n=1 Tax=Nocardia sp. CDC153 TaxID=3112167 RepID=UPI002DBAFF1C|nr:hypothetical protein [Nocardia sp. CDC153]MEC3957785.1 hypothetical protein [Nocardia sp. CDC153]
MSMTAFPVLARILTDSKLIAAMVGSLALASAAIDDVIGGYMVAFVSAIVTSRGIGDLLEIRGRVHGEVTRHGYSGGQPEDVALETKDDREDELET